MTYRAAQIVLAASIVGALLAQGAVLPREQAALVVGLGLAAVLGLAGSGAPVGRLGWGLALLAAGVVPALVPVSKVTLAQLAPGLARRLPEGVTTWTVGLDSGAAVAGAAGLAIAGLAAVSALRVAPSREAARPVLAAAAAVWAALGALHVATGWQGLLGVLPSRPGEGVFWAPLVNPNHHGLVLVAALPLVVAEARARRGALRWALVLLAAWTLAFPIVAASMGLVVALGAVGAVAWGRSARPRSARVAVGVGAVGAGALAVEAVRRAQPEWWALSAAPRLTQWADTLPLLRDHPAFGVGLGSYEAAYPPYRTVRAFARFEHAHSDVLEWIAETGAVGALAGVGAVALALPAWRRAPTPWAASVAAIAAHACLDFPLHLPGVLALGAVVATLALRDESAVERGRPGWAAVAGVVALVASGGLVHRGARLDDVAAARARPPGAAAVARLAEDAPWRVEPALAAFEAAPSVAAAEAVASGFLREGSALARISAGLARIGEDAASVRFARLSLREDPNDYRVWRLLATRLARGDDPFAAANAWAETLRRWPREQLGRDDPFDDAFEVLPLGSYWLIALADAPAHWSVRLSRRMLVEERWDLAEAACRQAGRIRPAAHAWMAECAEAIAGAGRADEALAYARSWVSARPSDAWGWLTLADRLADGGPTADLPGQVRALRRAQALRPQGPHVARRVVAAARASASCADDPACPTRDVAVELRRWAETER